MRISPSGDAEAKALALALYQALVVPTSDEGSVCCLTLPHSGSSEGGEDVLTGL